MQHICTLNMVSEERRFSSVVRAVFRGFWLLNGGGAGRGLDTDLCCVTASISVCVCVSSSPIPVSARVCDGAS